MTIYHCVVIHFLPLSKQNPRYISEHKFHRDVCMSDCAACYYFPNSCVYFSFKIKDIQKWWWNCYLVSAFKWMQSFHAPVNHIYALTWGVSTPNNNQGDNSWVVNHYECYKEMYLMILEVLEIHEFICCCFFVFFFANCFWKLLFTPHLYTLIYNMSSCNSTAHPNLL